MRIKNFFLKYWLFIFLSALVTFFSFFYFINTNKIQKDKSILKLPLLKNLEIDFYPILTTPKYSPKIKEAFSSFNKTIPIYQLNLASLSDQEAIKIAQKLGFLNQPKVNYDQQGGSIYNWDEDDKSLLINLSWGTVNYNLNLSNYQNINPESLPSFNQAEEIAKNFLRENNFYPPEKINLETKNISYVSNWDVELKKVTSLKEATLIQVEFIYKIDNKEIINPYINFAINNQNQVVILRYQNLPKEIKNFESYPLKTAEELIKAVTEKKSISYLQISDYYGAVFEESKNIIDLNLNNINLVYYISSLKQLYLQPVFLITGEATLKDGSIGEIGIYIPAIKDEYLLK